MPQLHLCSGELVFAGNITGTRQSAATAAVFTTSPLVCAESIH
jgi:hypothetical protein